jgi:hypothetical protein
MKYFLVDDRGGQICFYTHHASWYLIGDLSVTGLNYIKEYAYVFTRITAARNYILTLPSHIDTKNITIMNEKTLPLYLAELKLKRS